MTNSNRAYQERLTRFNTALDKGTPDRVPVFPIIEQWAQLVTGTSIKDSYTKDPMLTYEAFKKVYERVYVDISYGTGNLIPLKMMSNFGEGIYQVTEEGVQIKGSHGTTMQADEYPQLIKDPQGFIMETILPRKYPILNDGKQAVKSWYHAIFDIISFFSFDKKTVKAIETKLGVPVVAKGATFLPPDVMLDFLRDFVGTANDIRRQPNAFYDACEALYPLMLNMALNAYPNPTEAGLIFMPLHLPTYLRPKDFEKLYFPFMKRMAEDLIQNGYRMMFYMENDWAPYLDMLQDMPKGPIFGMFEYGNIKTIKEKVGNRFCIGGGMPVNLLKMGTKDQCIDAAKKCLDELAPGGNYVFGLDKNLLSKEDAKIENLAAVCEYVHVHGKY
ncbi:MAG: uroporphyrinogen decarboxylase family protein [Anaerofustis sp.]